MDVELTTRGWCMDVAWMGTWMVQHLIDGGVFSEIFALHHDDERTDLEHHWIHKASARFFI